MADQPTIPTLLERAQVPAHFPLFRNAASLAHLAHNGSGPPYILVGGKAWYEVADITEWIEQNKRRGREPEDPEIRTSLPPKSKRRGRPTKMQQYFRSLRPPANARS
jgi:hypothetical protein